MILLYYRNTIVVQKEESRNRRSRLRVMTRAEGTPEAPHRHNLSAGERCSYGSSWSRCWTTRTTRRASSGPEGAWSSSSSNRKRYNKNLHAIRVRAVHAGGGHNLGSWVSREALGTKLWIKLIEITNGNYINTSQPAAVVRLKVWLSLAASQWWGYIDSDLHFFCRRFRCHFQKCVLIS